MVHHERAARALERLGILCYDVAKPMKECGCQETVFTNSLVGTKTGGRPVPLLKDFDCLVRVLNKLCKPLSEDKIKRRRENTWQNGEKAHYGSS